MDWLMLKDLYEQFIQAADSFCQTLIVVFIKPNLDKGTTSELGLGKGVCQVISGEIICLFPASILQILSDKPHYVEYQNGTLHLFLHICK